jgi:hypothetical protein
MAAFVRAHRTNSSKVSGSTFDAILAATVPVGNLLVVTTGFDNSGTNAPTVTFSDTKGNTWTTLSTTYGGGTSSATGLGAAIGFCYVQTQLASTDTVTATYSASITAKTLSVVEFSQTLDVEDSAAVVANGSSTTPSATSGTVSNGSVVIGMMANELDQTGANDTDTTNGSWASAGAIATAGGNAASNIGQRANYKIVTGSGTQTYNPVLTTTADWVALVAVLKSGTKQTASSSATGTSSATGSRLVTTIATTASSSGTSSSTATVPVASFTDDFSRANSTTSIGGNWIVRAGTLGITSNQGYPVTATATATQPIRSSAFKQVVRAKIVADPAVNSAVNVLIAWKDSSNYIAAVRSQPFATWVLVSVVGGVTTNHGNTGLSATTDVWVHIVRDGTAFQISAQSTTAGAGQSRSATFTISGFEYNDVGFLFPSSGTAYTVDDFTARAVETSTRTASSSGAGTSSATRVVVRLRTATSAGAGTSAASRTIIKLRTATAPATGTSAAERTATRVRTASAAGSGSATATRTVSPARTATSTGSGSSTATGSRLSTSVDRTATAAGAGSSTATGTSARARTATGTGVGGGAAEWVDLFVVVQTDSGTAADTETLSAALAALDAALGSDELGSRAFNEADAGRWFDLHALRYAKGRTMLGAALSGIPDRSERPIR